ncbi:MAG: LbetaH domain-containing protein [Planctomycetota bacterium]|jgi:hypothetical protein
MMLSAGHRDGQPFHPSPLASRPEVSDLGVLRRLRAVILMSGQMRQNRFSQAVQRAMLELPVGNGLSLIDHWRQQLGDLAQVLQVGALPTRVMMDQDAVLPAVNGQDHRLSMSIERDPRPFRGVGGVLQDLAADYADDDYLLMVHGLQILVEPISHLACELGASGGKIAILSHRDGVPSGMMLLPCAALRNIPGEGFVDLKEQAMPKIAQAHPITVVHRMKATGYPVRTLTDYLNALRLYHFALAGKPTVLDPFAENLEPNFAVIEEGAEVDDSAILHDSVVLKGGRVGRGAIVVRSVVCPGGIVRRNQRAVDRIVAPPSTLRQEGGRR